MSAEERKTIGDKDFDNRLDQLTGITVLYGGFLGGTEERHISFDGEKIVAERHGYNGFYPELTDDGELYKDQSRTSLIEGFKEFHIGRWKKRYYNPDVLDGTQWEVTFFFSDGTTVEAGGSNSFPANFRKFLKLMEMK